MDAQIKLKTKQGRYTHFLHTKLNCFQYSDDLIIPNSNILTQMDLKQLAKLLYLHDTHNQCTSTCCTIYRSLANPLESILCAPLIGSGN